MEVEEPMDVDTTGDIEKFDDLLEEGECEEPNNRVSRKTLSSIVSIPESRIENSAGTFVTGVDIFSKESKAKLEERAKRFGLSKSEKKAALKEAEDLYESFGIVEGTETARNFRLNVIHMRGTERMSTKDVFKYFEDYAPASLEWINDISCNVVWLDKESAARALLGLSRKIVGIKKKQNQRNSDDDSNEDSEDYLITNGKHYGDEKKTLHVKDIRCPLPPGIWRKGRDHMDSRNILLRFATRSDKKPPQAEKMSEYYKKHGDSNHGGLKGILTTSRKRAYKETKEPSPVPKKEPGTNGIAAKNPWGSLSKTWGVADVVEDDYLPKAPPEPVSNVKERLGFKPHRREVVNNEDEEEEIVQEDPNIIELSDDSEAESSSDEENWCKRSKMPRMRMHADDEEQKLQKRKGKIRNMVNQRVKGSGSDLRGRLIARRRLPPPVYQEPAIQVVVTNSKALRSKSSFRTLDVTEDEDDDDDERQDDEIDEEEEGEIIGSSDSDSKVEYEEEEVEEEEDEEEEEEEETNEQSESDYADDSSDSSVSEKEIQGPKGSVIKVVQHKPKLASTVSTVWSRLNHSKNDRNDRTDRSSQERYHSKSDLRHALKKNDLRSRIGNHHMRGRSPLRIELRNDKYSGKRSDSE